jgi:hypothetical protein
MKRTLAFGYVTIGFLAGIAFSAGVGSDPTVILQRFGFFIAALFLIGTWQWFEEYSHRRHLETWATHVQRGKWNFILLRYVLARGIVIVLLIVLPFVGKFNASSDTLLVLGITTLVCLSALGFLGHQEWSNCRQESEIRLLTEAARRGNP